jgi:hypothetical protein
LLLTLRRFSDRAGIDLFERPSDVLRSVVRFGGRASLVPLAIGWKRRVGVGVAVDARDIVVLERWIAEALSAKTRPHCLALLHRAEAAARHVISVQAAILTGARRGWREQCTKRNCGGQCRGGNCRCSQYFSHRLLSVSLGLNTLRAALACVGLLFGPHVLSVRVKGGKSRQIVASRTYEIDQPG